MDQFESKLSPELCLSEFIQKGNYQNQNALHWGEIEFECRADGLKSDLLPSLSFTSLRNNSVFLPTHVLLFIRLSSSDWNFHHVRHIFLSELFVWYLTKTDVHIFYFCVCRSWSDLIPYHRWLCRGRVQCEGLARLAGVRRNCSVPGRQFKVDCGDGNILVSMSAWYGGHAQVFTAFRSFYLFKKLEGEEGNKNKTWKMGNLTYLTWHMYSGVRVVNLSKTSFGVNEACYLETHKTLNSTLLIGGRWAGTPQPSSYLRAQGCQVAGDYSCSLELHLKWHWKDECIFCPSISSSTT